jgi:hypothetical protein
LRFFEAMESLWWEEEVCSWQQDNGQMKVSSGVNKELLALADLAVFCSLTTSLPAVSSMHMHFLHFLVVTTLLISWSLANAQPRHGDLDAPTFALLRHALPTTAEIQRPPSGAQRCNTCVLSFSTERRFREHWRAIHAHPIPQQLTRVIHHPLLTGKHIQIYSYISGV